MGPGPRTPGMHKHGRWGCCVSCGVGLPWVIALRTPGAPHSVTFFVLTEHSTSLQRSFCQLGLDKIGPTVVQQKLTGPSDGGETKPNNNQPEQTQQTCPLFKIKFEVNPKEEIIRSYDFSIEIQSRECFLFYQLSPSTKLDTGHPFMALFVLYI